MTTPTCGVENKPPIRCLVIQLARLGDTLQSLMALRAAKQLYPHLEIHFLARERFSHAAKRVSWIKNVITLPTDELLGPILIGRRTETEGLSEIARWLAPLVKETWDLVLNWTYSDSSSYLTGLLPAHVKLGYTRRPDSTHACTDGWSQYIQGIVQGRVYQNIHLTDILTTQLLTALQIHAGDPLPEGNAPVTSKGFFSLTLSETDLSRIHQIASKKWIAIQLGAGQASKTWDPSHWAKFAQYLLKRHPEYGIYLLGGKEDLVRAQSFSEEIRPFLKTPQSLISLVGETNFDLWTNVVSRSQWLVAGDTAAIHLASVLGTRILNISVGPVRYEETGPYGNGHYVITSGNPCEACLTDSHQIKHTCRSDISPEAAYATWSYAANEWAHRRQISLENHFTHLGWIDHLETVRVYRSRIRGTHDGGGVVYELMTKKPARLQDWTSKVIGQVARSWYCGWTPPVGQELSRASITAPLIQKLRELQSSTEVLSKICEKANQIATTLNQKSGSLKSNRVMGIRDREELMELGQALNELETLIEKLAKTHAPLMAFSQMSKVMMHNLKGTHLADLGKETAACYRQIRDGVTLFRDWIQYTMDLAKPVAIHPPKLVVVDSLHNPSGKELSP